VIIHHFPELGVPSPTTYARWFEEICRRTATLVTEWMRVGFVHGVLNTDNMSILGLTIDYGPYGWLEGYDLQWTPNTTDAQGRRYCYGNQPNIAQWNLVRLANALAPLIQDTSALEKGLAIFADTFELASGRMLADKLGLASLEREGDDKLLGDLFELLQSVETDMTLFFRNLALLPIDNAPDTLDDVALIEPLRRAFYSEDAFAQPHLSRLSGWVRRYIARVRQEQDSVAASRRRERMNRANPKYVFRNYLAQQAIDALEAGDVSVMERLMSVLQNPYDDQPAHDELANRRPEWARHKAGCSALSCSS
jgi:uncharacterized protein YdiU (UPF0061 family)